MKKTLSYISLILFFFSSFPAISQEFLSGLEVNQTIRNMSGQTSGLKSLSAGTLELPFFDDFSRSHVFPDQARWSDRNVFINNDYPVNPISAGVATFDAIDHTGALYDHATTWPFVADMLTSQPVNLDYLPEDSIYLSFFFQPQGKGDVPQDHDSLRVEFYSPLDDTWRVVWSVPGTGLHDFRLAMIPVTDHRYLQSGFRFRFSNIASVAVNRYNPGARSNGDHWHVDYVYLDRNRHQNDTVFQDVTMTGTAGTLLNNYIAMPWRHFSYGRAAEMSSVFKLVYRNNDNVSRTAGRHYSIENFTEGRTIHLFSGGQEVIHPGEIKEYYPDLAFTFPLPATNPATFRVKAWLETDDVDYKGNDTITFYQVFSNYFALDDGTAENGYGLFGGGTENARLAYRFSTYVGDSLRALRIYFNQSLNHASRQYFHIAVWDDNNGRPGNLIYSQEGSRPEYEGELNMFHTYHLDSPAYVPSVFYVGLIQTSGEFLNIGWDVNTDNSNRIFYNINGEWENTAFKGSLMIRPVVGDPLPVPRSADPPGNSGIKIYPNPASRILYIEFEDGTEPGVITYRLINPSGQIVHRGTGYERQINLSSFPPGIYLLQLEDKAGSIKTRRIFITH